MLGVLLSLFFLVQLFVLLVLWWYCWFLSVGYSLDSGGGWRGGVVGRRCMFRLCWLCIWQGIVVVWWCRWFWEVVLENDCTGMGRSYAASRQVNCI